MVFEAWQEKLDFYELLFCIHPLDQLFAIAFEGIIADVGLFNW